MRLATLDNGRADGRLIVVSRDGLRFQESPEPISSLQMLMEGWEEFAAVVGGLSARLDAGDGQLLGERRLRAALPRAWQWLDGSAFPSHAALMQKALGLEPVKSGRPFMYQGLSDTFLGPREDVRVPSEDLDIDFEGEFGVIVDAVRMGSTPEECLAHIRLIVQINDWSLRALAGPEMKTGFGWVQAKPACSMAPIAVTPDELGPQWRDGRVCCDLRVEFNGQHFGSPNGAEMEFGFHELIAHAARTRDLVAGTVVGSGTVSNAGYRQVGSSCIAERRGIEIVDGGAPKTGFMLFGDRVRMETMMSDGSSPFGVIDQRVVGA